MCRLLQQLGFDELLHLSIYRQLLSELLGSICFGYITDYCFSKQEWTAVQMACALGLTLAMLTKALGPLSGCHINPAVTLGYFSIGELRLVRTLCYVGAQAGGQIVGVASGDMRVPGKRLWHSHPAIIAVHNGLEPWQTALIELVITLLFVLVFMSMTDAQGEEMSYAAAMAIGVAYAAAHLAAAPWTSASMNPARSLAFSMKICCWRKQWVFGAGPVGGGVLAAIIYKYCFKSISYTR